MFFRFFFFLSSNHKASPDLRSDEIELIVDGFYVYFSKGGNDLLQNGRFNEISRVVFDLKEFSTIKIQRDEKKFSTELERRAGDMVAARRRLGERGIMKNALTLSARRVWPHLYEYSEQFAIIWRALNEVRRLPLRPRHLVA